MKNLRMRSRGALIAGIMLIALALVLAACGKSSNQGTSSNGGTPKAGGTYNYPLEGADPVGIAPNTFQESVGYNVVRQIFEGLFKTQVEADGATVKVVPNLCEKYTVSKDARVFTFTIRQGVKFQPPVNREVKAQDVVASWNAVADPKNWVTGTPAYILEPIVGTDATGAAKHGLTGVKATGDWTVEVTLKVPFADFVASLVHPIMSVWPVDYAMKEGLKTFAQKPIGTGPYMLQKWVHNQEVDLVKNPSWWNASATNGPFVDTIHMPVFMNTSTEWLAFQGGSLDFTSVPVGQVTSSQALAASKGWIAKKYPLIGAYYIYFNMKDPVVGGAKGLPLRQALSYAVDRNAVITTVGEGVNLVPNGIVPVGVAGANLSKLPYPYDPAKAKQIVSGLGTVPTLKLWYNTGSDHDKILAPVQAGWKAIGLNVTMTGYEWGTYLTKLPQGTQDQIYRLGWNADYPAMDNFLFPLFQSSQSPINTFSFYSNPTVDKLIATARSTTDETQRLQIYAQAEKQILADAPVIPLYFYREYRIVNKRVLGQTYDPMGSEDMNLVWVAQ